jgi:hypothetical protein
MATEASDPTALAGVALLEALRPAPGWVTESAIGTTYSLELPVALASLIALSGTVRDTSDYTLHAAFRALESLRDRVRIVAQSGRIACPPIRQSSALHLLDEIVLNAKCDEAQRSFHPKLWLVRWRDVSGTLPVRWRLVVGSRNLTSAAAWDLGVTLDGTEDGDGASFENLADFLDLVSDLSGAGPFMQRFRAVTRVRWEAPAGARAMHFGFHGNRPLSWDETALATLADGPKRLLAISPFLDGEAVCELAKRFRIEHPNEEPGMRLVGGLRDLEDVAYTQRGRKALAELADIRGTAAANEALALSAPAADTPAQGSDVRDVDVGLHAKAIVVTHSRDDVSVLFGSPNLTRRGWTGRNVETWVCLRGRAFLGGPLWAWAARFPTFILPGTLTAPAKTTEEALEEAADFVRFSMVSASLVLREPAAGEPTLTSTVAVPNPPPNASLEVGVARLSSVEQPHLWACGATTVRLSPCAAGDRTRFVRFRVRLAQDDVQLERSWVQEVQLDPSLDVRKRDAEAMASALGPSGFLAYLKGLVEPAVDDADSPEEDDLRSGGSYGKGGPGDEALSLEWLLRAFARRGPSGVEELRARLSNAIAGYRSAIGSESDKRLEHLWVAWDAVDAALSGATRPP